MILLAFVTAGLAGERAVLVLPSTGAPGEGALVELLDVAGYDVEETRDARSFLQRARVVQVPTQVDGECPSAIPSATLDGRLAAAKAKYQTLDLAGALADFSSIDLDLPCASAPVSTGFVFALDLARAEANLELSEASRDVDPQKAGFFAQEAAAALDRAVVVAEGLPAPRSLDRGPREALASARERRDQSLPPRWTVLGTGGGELFVNGVLATTVALDGIVGENLLQVVRDGAVAGSSRVGMRVDEPVVFDLDHRFDSDGPAAVIESLVRSPPDNDERALLAAVAAVVEPGAAVAFAGWEGREPVVWLAELGEVRKLAPGAAAARRVAEPAPKPRSEPPQAVEQLGRVPETKAMADARKKAESAAARKQPTVSRTPAPVVKNAGQTSTTSSNSSLTRARRVDAWVATAGVNIGGGWRSPRLDGTEQADGEATLALSGRVRAAPNLSLAWGIAPTGSISSFNLAGTGVDGDVPVRVGLRFGQQIAHFAPDAGLDLGFRLGADEAGVATVEPTLGLCTGGSGATGRAAALRFEVCGAFGSDVIRLAITLGIESRLGPG